MSAPAGEADHLPMYLGVSRRRFLQASGAAAAGSALLIAIRVPALGAATNKAPTTLAGWVRVDADKGVTLLVNATEMGQGAKSALAQILAEELELEWSQVRVDFAPVEPAYYGMWETYQTGGSGSVRGMFDRLRKAGATARMLLTAAAAKRWKVPVEECRARQGAIYHTRSSRKATYAALASDAASLPTPENIGLKARDKWNLIGKSLPRLDTASKVNGSAVYGIDVKRPQMLCAAIAQCPTLRGRLQSVDPQPAMNMARVSRVVTLDDAVVVVAKDYWSAKKALAALKPVWDPGKNATTSSTEIAQRLRELTTAEGKVFVPEGTRESESELRQRCESALAKSARIIERTYEAPMLSHSPMEPMNATAHVSGGRAELWVPTQVQSDLKTAVAKALALPESAVTIHTTEVGGGFGRRLQVDYGRQAALVAQKVGVPVKLMWSREEDTQHGFYRPAAVARLRAGVDAEGAITAFQAQLACMDSDTPVGGMAAQPYALPNTLITYSGWNPGVPLGAWRSVDASQNLFFFESFIDELAHELKQDSLNLRRRLLANEPRALRVLDAVARLANWEKPLPSGHGRGVALLRGYGSVSAQVAEVSVDSDRTLRVHRVSCAIDCGTAVNPSGVRAQFEGGVLFGLTAAALDQITVQNGRVEQANFDTYPIGRIAQAPRVDVEILESPDEAIGGAGEPPVPPIAPAVANAIFAATGQRVRKLPLKAEGFSWGNRQA
jgi:isoquinoline 1-oxidoreductase beta subunit